MAAPVLAGYNTASSNGTAVTSLAFSKPSGVSVGDILFIIVGSDDSTDTVQFSINATNHPGWTKQGESGGATTDAHIAIFTKVADNDADENSVTVDAVSSDEMQGIYGYVTGGDSAGILYQDQNDSSSPWIANFSRNSGVTDGDEYLVIAGMSMDGGDGGTITSNKNDLDGTANQATNVNSGTSGNDNQGAYARHNATVSGTTLSAPTTFTTGDRDDGAACATIAIKEEAAAGKAPPPISPLLNFRHLLMR